MTIEDPTALPETDAAVEEYVHAADQAWQAENQDLAWSLYHSIYISTIGGAANHHSLAAFRLGSIALARGQADEAYRYLKFSNEPGAADLLRAVDGSTVDHPVDPNVVPQTVEELDRYVAQLSTALQSHDHATADALADVCWQSPAANPSTQGAIARHQARSFQQRNDLESARRWAESGVSLATGDDLTDLHALLREIGTDVQDGGNPYQTAQTQRLLDGIAAFERGDAATARTELEAVVAATEGATVEDKARARYYLGSMDYHARHFATAREHLHEARANAPANEQAWATQLLEVRWDEHESPL